MLAAIDDLPLDVTVHETTSGIAALLTGEQAGPDGAPARRHGCPADARGDRPRFRLAARRPMHACGHDTHTAMLVGAARLLSARRDELAGSVLFMFQPGEEGHHGARFMLDDGLLEWPLPDGRLRPSRLALHISSLPTGCSAAAPVRCSPRPTSSASTSTAAAATPRAAPRARSGAGRLRDRHRDADDGHATRRVADPAVVTVGQIKAGTTNNIIPETRRDPGHDPHRQRGDPARVTDNIRRVAKASPRPTALTATVDDRRRLPRHCQRRRVRRHRARRGTATVARRGQRLELPHPIMGAEDFSYVLQKVPGTMMFLGATPLDRDLGSAAPNHSNRVYFDEPAMARGITTNAAVAINHLAAG